MDFSMDNIAELLGNMQEDDLQSLREAAQTLFGGTEQTHGPDDADDTGIDPQMLRRTTRILHAMQSGQDNRSALIRALKPYLSAPRQKKADEAMQILRLLDVLPMLQQ